MYSPYRIEYTGPALLALTALLLGGCERGSAQAKLPVSQAATPAVIGSALVPGITRPAVTSDPRAAQYFDNADAVNTGKRLFADYNCNGCHSNGGGGMGPSLMDNQWIYGGRLEQIHQTLVVGRPNGMPAWGGKIPDEQLWQLAAYVRSLSLPATLAANHSDTPGQEPAPVPKDADDHAGWSPPPDTTNDYTAVITGPAQ
jgi:cytochrome c oxidase cbb3-type subunit 3